jgi:DNA-directed RNA polymerase subunit omega
MIPALKSDQIIEKVGGRFRLTALIQRRLKELIEGSRPLVETEGRNLVEIVVAEIDEDKISIDYEKSENLDKLADNGTRIEESESSAEAN